MIIKNYDLVFLSKNVHKMQWNVVVKPDRKVMVTLKKK